MKFWVLGSGTGLPDPYRGPAGFLLHVDGHYWLIDGGSGTTQKLARLRVRPENVDGLFYSHRHPDHCADFIPFLFAVHIEKRRSRPISIVAGEGFREFWETLSEAYGSWVLCPGNASIHLYEHSIEAPAKFQNDGLTVRTAPAVHGKGALHLRFEAHGRSVTYSGDTAPSTALIDLAQNTDLLVCECAGSDDKPIPGHLSPLFLKRIAEEARPREIWVTHFYPHVDIPKAIDVIASAGVPVRHAHDMDCWG